MQLTWWPLLHWSSEILVAEGERKTFCKQMAELLSRKKHLPNYTIMLGKVQALFRRPEAEMI